MGKASRKVAKKQQEKKVIEQKVKAEEIQVQLTRYKEAGDYENGLQQVVELLEMGCGDAEVFFNAAELYFMAGDYERANMWINRTMEVESGHIGARILLSRICLESDREESALDILEMVLKLAGNSLTMKQQNEIEELVGYFRSTRTEEKIRVEHPYVATFLGWKEEKDDANVQEDVLVQKEETAETVCKDILMKDISVQEKVRLCNSFAGAYYYEDRIEDAKTMLLAANSLADDHAATLRNLIVLLTDLGEREAALSYASKLPETDFFLLRLLKK